MVPYSLILCWLSVAVGVHDSVWWNTQCVVLLRLHLFHCCCRRLSSPRVHCIVVVLRWRALGLHFSSSFNFKYVIMRCCSCCCYCYWCFCC